MKWLHKEKSPEKLFYSTDLHSHILPGIDDGSPDVETSMTLLRALQSWGIRQIFVTPHVIASIKNTPETIAAAYNSLCNRMRQENIHLCLHFSAEYRMDEHFAELLQEGEKAFILLPGRHLLVENPFSQAPMVLEDFLFQLMLKDIHPIWAHPERYRYYHTKREIYTHMHDKGILFQVNLLSLAGYYGKEVKEVAWWLGQNGWIDLLGSDLHDTRQAQAVTGWLSTPEYQRAAKMLRMLKNDLLFSSKEE